jgi:tRNA uridine 5-carboxymethylaminomethyl modification enzyme
MEGRIFIGEFDAPSGRLGEPAAIGLGSALRRKGFAVGRLKTGTPARVRKSSLDLDVLEEQPGDEPMLPFSFDYERVDRPQLSCWITWTNEATHDIIRKNIGRSPLYGGKIVGRGPRYCPSIEDKVVRFPDRDQHQIFIEPEGAGTEEMYLNGCRPPCPKTCRLRSSIRSKGWRTHRSCGRRMRLEYDYLDPCSCIRRLRRSGSPACSLQGQTNGTSGYEEAACQGLLAGINAAQKLKGEPPLVFVPHRSLYRSADRRSSDERHQGTVSDVHQPS